jgi:hypothetical protein
VQARYDIEAEILCSKRKGSMIQSLFLWSHLEVLIPITAVRSPSISYCTRAHVKDLLLLTGFGKKSKAIEHTLTSYDLWTGLHLWLKDTAL